MDRSYACAFAATDLTDVIARIYKISGTLFDRGCRQEAAKLDELPIEMFQLQRELLELSRQSGVPAALEDSPDAA